MKGPLERALCEADICREQGRIGWHDLQHTYGSHLAMRGVPLKAIQELMGHATIEMTERHAHLSPEVRRAPCSSSTSLCPTSKPLRPEAPKGHTEGTCGNEGKEKAQ